MSRLRSRANAARKGPQPTQRPRQVLARPNEQGPAQPMAPQGVYRRTRSDGAGLRPAEFASLQRAVGNRLVQRMRSEQGELQPKRSLWAATDSSAVEDSHSPSGATVSQGGVLQRTANYKTLLGTTSYAAVDDGGNPITMTGSLHQNATTVVDIVGSLTYHAVEIPRAAVSWLPFGTVNALEIGTVTANPQGRCIGQLLVWHLARLAQDAGIEYITAGNVTAARDKFYTPLGFVDFENAPSWKESVARKAQLEQQMAETAAPAPAIAQEYKKVVDAMKENKIFISVDVLEANAAQRWRQEWAPE